MQWIDTCLKSIVNSSTKLDIIVIDNNSSDGTVSYIKKQYPEIILFEQKTNLGFGKANNLGMSHALNNNCDYVFLLNQDAYLEVDSIGRMIEVHKENSEYGILSPIHLNGSGNKLDKNFSSYVAYDSNNFFHRDALKNEMKPVYDVSFVNAAAWLLPVSTLKIIGGFDPIFFHYGEDDNYCQRVLFHSLKIGVVSNSYVKHDRENINKRPVLNYRDKLKKTSIGLKLEWGNINKNINEEIISRGKSIFKKTIRNFILLRFTKGHHYYLEFKLIRSLKKDIYISRNTNTEKGSHYLIKRNE